MTAWRSITNVILRAMILAALTTFASAQQVSQSIYDNGNVGIGTTNPGTKLEVAGDVTAGVAGGGYHLIVNVPTKVSAENGPINRGDLLVSAGTPGHAMKGTDRAQMLGAVVGKALEPFANGTGVINVLVTLQ